VTDLFQLAGGDISITVGNFLGTSNIVAATTITGDTVCRSTNTVYRMDTDSARSFLKQFVTLP